MKSKHDSSQIAERCDSCADETPHVVSIEIRTENEHAENSAFSREPYRISTCVVCGAETGQRMNDQ
ncbi:hypothetical protein ACFFQF_00770 [Haladaptatus pallidirubidus]|uniref:DUF7835 family putative zinc beta-ribbon protein n=1 Tax=Haladaptatus pallidirubidus TaxID=1008152 RepID=UPI001D1114D5|nr:hypothetical protein [Haladaptatus pallidirubidus]